MPSDWFTHIQWLYNLQRGGYPFARDDLTLAEWMALAEMSAEYDAMRIGAPK